MSKPITTGGSVMHDRTRQQALKALDGMAKIVRAERIERGVYVTDEVVDHERVGQLCGGRNYCAIGSLWVGGGVKVKEEVDSYDDRRIYISLPGVDEGETRTKFLSRRPGLRAAYDALNAAATRYMARNNIDRDDLVTSAAQRFEANVEQLFEGKEDLGRTELLRIIASAKRSVKAAP